MPAPESPSNEFRLIAEFLGDLDAGSAVHVGNGDDAAVLDLEPHEQLVVSTDVAVEGVHFPGQSPADRMAYRAVAAAVSDLAAMGARPLAMTLNLILPDTDEALLAGLRKGLGDAVAAFDLPLVGGDLVRGAFSLGVQVLGAVPHSRALKRAGARPGDLLCVSGCLGDAACGLALELGEISAATAQDAEYLRNAFWRPQPALALGELLRDQATAAIDVSDGLLADAGHLARAGNVRLTVDSEAVPLSDALIRTVDEDTSLRMALTGGEDYVLCFTLPNTADLPSGCRVIGRVERGSGVTCDREYEADGYQHF